MQGSVFAYCILAQHENVDIFLFIRTQHFSEVYYLRKEIVMKKEIERNGNILIYQTEKGDTRIDVYFEEDTIWMTQRSMAELYQSSPQNITQHIRRIYADGELDEVATCKNFLQV